jgi:hypothetical protein
VLAWCYTSVEMSGLCRQRQAQRWISVVMILQCHTRVINTNSSNTWRKFDTNTNIKLTLGHDVTHCLIIAPVFITHLTWTKVHAPRYIRFWSGRAIARQLNVAKTQVVPEKLRHGVARWSSNTTWLKRPQAVDRVIWWTFSVRLLLYWYINVYIFHHLFMHN